MLMVFETMLESLISFFSTIAVDVLYVVLAIGMIAKFDDLEEMIRS